MRPNCLLAPVPIVHLEDAPHADVIAFGSNSFDVLDKLRKAGAVGALDVYVVPSKTGLRAGDKRQSVLKVGWAQFRGTLHGIVDADRRGRHPMPERRPASALETDDPWGLFWEVSDLARIDPIPLERFSTRTGTPWKTVPEGPVEARLDPAGP